MVGMARYAACARVLAGGTNDRAALTFEGVAPLHVARTSQRDVPTHAKHVLIEGSTLSGRSFTFHRFIRALDASILRFPARFVCGRTFPSPGRMAPRPTKSGCIRKPCRRRARSG